VSAVRFRPEPPFFHGREDIPVLLFLKDQCLFKGTANCLKN
jgi:hypothetical protein